MSVPQCGRNGVPEVLLRFQAAVLGMGSITGPNDRDMYVRRAGGAAEAQATVALLWSQLGSVKRTQAGTAMRSVRRQYHAGAFKPRAPRRRGYRPWHMEHRAFASDAFSSPDRGHEYSHVYMSASGPKQRCNACARILSREKRAKEGIKPRQFKNVARRYTL